MILAWVLLIRFRALLCCTSASGGRTGVVITQLADLIIARDLDFGIVLVIGYRKQVL